MPNIWQKVINFNAVASDNVVLVVKYEKVLVMKDLIVKTMERKTLIMKDFKSRSKMKNYMKNLNCLLFQEVLKLLQKQRVASTFCNAGPLLL